MLTFSEKYGRNYKFSQNREEGILEEALRRMGIRSGVAVELGGNDGKFCSNTALLAEQGWRVTFVETDYSLYEKSRDNWRGSPNVRSQCCHIDRCNVNAFVKADCDILSVDLDGGDYEIFRGLQARPKIVIVEIDSSIPPDSDSFNSDGGAGYKPMVNLALSRGYFLLAHTGNLILVCDEYVNLFQEVWGTHPIRDYEQYFNRAWLKEAAA